MFFFPTSSTFSPSLKKKKFLTLWKWKYSWTDMFPLLRCEVHFHTVYTQYVHQRLRARTPHLVYVQYWTMIGFQSGIRKFLAVHAHLKFRAKVSFPSRADGCENRLLVSNCAHRSLCTVKVKHPNGRTIGPTHVWVEWDLKCTYNI